MNNLHIEFKKDTGLNPYIEFETKSTNYKYDRNFWYIEQDDIEQKIPSSFYYGNIKLISDEYINWLENKVNELSK